MTTAGPWQQGWSVGSNVVYLVPLKLCLPRGLYIRALGFAALMVASGGYHLCADAWTGCADETTWRMRHVDHTMATWMTALTFTLLVPFGRAERFHEAFIDLVSLTGAALVVWLYGIDGPTADGLKGAVVGVTFVLALCMGLCTRASVTANMIRISLSLGVTGTIALVVCAVVVVALSALLWYLPELQGEVGHAFWHVSTGVVASVIIYYARANPNSPKPTNNAYRLTPVQYTHSDA